MEYVWERMAREAFIVLDHGRQKIRGILGEGVLVGLSAFLGRLVWSCQGVGPLKIHSVYFFTEMVSVYKLAHACFIACRNSIPSATTPVEDDKESSAAHRVQHGYCKHHTIIFPHASQIPS